MKTKLLEYAIVLLLLATGLLVAGNLIIELATAFLIIAGALVSIRWARS